MAAVLTQGEVSEIVTGKRVVTCYELSLQICDGFGLPRGGWASRVSDAY
jgi:hypothetical protein